MELPLNILYFIIGQEWTHVALLGVDPLFLYLQIEGFIINDIIIKLKNQTYLYIFKIYFFFAAR